jgi:hypothetical protein
VELVTEQLWKEFHNCSTPPNTRPSSAAQAVASHVPTACTATTLRAAFLLSARVRAASVSEATVRSGSFELSPSVGPRGDARRRYVCAYFA